MTPSRSTTGSGVAFFDAAILNGAVRGGPRPWQVYREIVSEFTEQDAIDAFISTSNIGEPGRWSTFRTRSECRVEPQQERV